VKKLRATLTEYDAQAEQIVVQAPGAQSDMRIALRDCSLIRRHIEFE
jgi:hypothetical protein